MATFDDVRGPNHYANPDVGTSGWWAAAQGALALALGLILTALLIQFF
jgi:hypothetical protein